MRKITAIIGLLFVLTPLLYGQSAEEVIQKVQEQVNTSEPIRVKFQQVFEWKLTGKEEKVQGSMVLQGLDKFRIDTPDQTIVSNGKTMWTYSRPENQVIIDTVRQSGQSLMPRDILFSYPDEYNTKIIQKSTELDGQFVVVLRMLPKNEDQFIQEIKVWINRESWKPMKVEFTDLNDNQTVYGIESIAKDANISEDAFQFQPPKEAEVIDVR